MRPDQGTLASTVPQIARKEPRLFHEMKTLVSVFSAIVQPWFFLVTRVDFLLLFVSSTSSCSRRRFVKIRVPKTIPIRILILLSGSTSYSRIKVSLNDTKFNIFVRVKNEYTVYKNICRDIYRGFYY